MKLDVIKTSNEDRVRHPKCKGFTTPDTGNGSDFDCEYQSVLDCEQCVYGYGKKYPQAKRNQPKEK